MELSQLVELLVEFVFFVEATPNWWFARGLSLPDVVAVTLGTYAIKLTLDVSLMHLVFAAIRRLFGWLANKVGLLRAQVTWWQQLDGKREALLLKLHRLGHLGLFLAGVVPGLSMLGPPLYVLDPLNRPWYRLWNFSFFWLYLGGAMRMLGSVWAIYKLIHSY